MDKVQLLQTAFRSGVTLNLKFRLEQLHAFQRMLNENSDLLCDGLKKDLNKGKHESMMCEINLLKKEVDYFINNLSHLVAPEKVARTFVTMTDSSYILRQPYGVVLIISAWNYPVVLMLQPLLGAIAAGNCVLAKPSELAVHTEKIMADLIPKYLDSRVCQVFCGGPQDTSELLKQRFDYICYTGSGRVGRFIMAAAAEHLTPLTLELGGKSPVYLDSNVDLPMAAKRIVWGKFTNAGQTCIAPDYVLCHADVLENFLELVKEIVKDFFGEDPSLSEDYCRIINQRNFDRLSQLLKSSKGKSVVSGELKPDQLYFPPTVLCDISSDDSLMSDELFGPILPILTVKSEDEAIEFINDREKPLALYVFSRRKEVMHKFELKTFSGGLLHNDTLIHYAVATLPFGGIGGSGMGNYHGKYSIETFTHKRAVLNKDTNEMFNNMMRYPPYTASKSSWMNWALSNSSMGKCSIL